MPWPKSAWNKLPPYRCLYNNFKRLNKGECMTYEEFLVFMEDTKCHYCSAPVSRKLSGCRTGHFIDRKDNALGHGIENCVTCCMRCNRGKNANFTYNQWAEIGKLIQTRGME